MPTPQVPPRALHPGFFSNRSHAIAPPLSLALLGKLKQLDLVNSTGFIAGADGAGPSPCVKGCKQWSVYLPGGSPGAEPAA